jgi:hypothetical protein
MSPGEIMNALSRLGVKVRVDGDDLVLTPSGKTPSSLKDEVRQRKPEIMTLLLGRNTERDRRPDSMTLAECQALLGTNVQSGFYRPPGKNQPRIPINGQGTTVLKASGLCSEDCAHDFGSPWQAFGPRLGQVEVLHDNGD